jgi:hypothetical protein
VRAIIVCLAAAKVLPAAASISYRYHVKLREPQGFAALADGQKRNGPALAGRAVMRGLYG